MGPAGVHRRGIASAHGFGSRPYADSALPAISPFQSPPNPARRSRLTTLNSRGRGSGRPGSTCCRRHRLTPSPGSLPIEKGPAAPPDAGSPAQPASTRPYEDSGDRIEVPASPSPPNPPVNGTKPYGYASLRCK